MNLIKRDIEAMKIVTFSLCWHNSTRKRESIKGCLRGQTNSEREMYKSAHLKEESVARSNLILNGNDGVREGEDTTGDAL